MLDKSSLVRYYVLAGLREQATRSSIEVVITGTTGNRVYPKRVPRVQIPPAPPLKNRKFLRNFRFFLVFGHFPNSDYFIF